MRFILRVPSSADLILAARTAAHMADNPQKDSCLLHFGEASDYSNVFEGVRRKSSIVVRKSGDWE